MQKLPKQIIIDILVILIIILCILFFSGCELQDTENNDYDYTAEYLNTRCDLDGEFRYYPAEYGGYCMECQFGMWRKVECSDFAGCH